MKPRSPVPALLCLLLAVGWTAAAQEPVSGPAALGLPDILASAAAESDGVAAAREARDLALMDLRASRPLASSSLALGAGAGLSTPSMASANASAGLALPILPNLAASASLSWTDRDLAAADGQGEGLSASAGLSWNPFASTSKQDQAAAALAASERALREAQAAARQAAYAAASSWLKAQASLASAREGLAIADLALSAVQLRLDRGQASPVELLQERAKRAEAERAAYRAGLSLDDAREALAASCGGSVAERIRSGAAISIQSPSGADEGKGDEAWAAPDFSAMAEPAAVLSARAALDAAGESVLSQGSGPLGLSAQVSGPISGGGASISLKASLNLDAALLSGRAGAKRDIDRAKAERALAAARKDWKAEYERAVRALSDAEFSLKMARYDLESATVALSRARLLEASGGISEVDLRKSVQALADARSARDAALLDLQAARAWFER